ncbi:MAG: YdcF family protein [Acidaminococcus sp.]|jgi:uncharacterized SAM-binding protein YcdF (DUF218 family)|nr:YdcF family protein [Acidaminococcus sp.]MCI2117505.1 YdcF family protein [Acidaminococcus sp.]
MYIIKFIYQWLLPPGIFILLALFGTIYAYRHHSKFRHVLLAATLLAYFLSIRIGSTLLVRPLETWYQPPKDISGDVLLMLGNGSVDNVPDIDGTGQPSGTMAKSMLTTFRLQKETGLPVLVSGGTVFQDTGTEADIALRIFRQMGIPDDKLTGENKSRNTVENARFSHVICDEKHWKKPILLVVAIQAPSSAMIFQREGLNVTVYPTHYRKPGSITFDPVYDLVPHADNLEDSSMAIKEYLGILALKVHAQ